MTKNNAARISTKRGTPESDDPAFDTPEAAAYMGVKPSTLEIWRSTGRYDLPYMKIGRCVRYRRSDLDTFLARRTFTHTGEVAA